MSAHHGQILRILRNDGPQSRAALARRSSLSATTLTHVAARLLKDGVILESETSAAMGLGRPAQAVRLAQDAYKVAGVHIGAGGAQVAITDLKACPKAVANVGFDVSAVDPAGLVACISESVIGLARDIQIDPRRLIGVGVGFPGPVDAARRSGSASINLNLRDMALASRFEAALRLPTVMEHNVSAMALAESQYGAGRDVAALLYVYLRAGLGAGLVVDGAPFRPGGHGAVELGHIQVAAAGRRCACGNSGCLETFVCERALMEAAGLSGPAPEHLMGLVEANGPAWEAIVDHLTTGLASAVNLLTPDLIVFGGHLGEAPDSLFDRLRAALPSRVMPHMRANLRLERASFGRGAGAIGAAAVALDHFFYSGALH